MIFKIGSTDILPYIAFGGLQWQREDLDGPNAGRALDGTMQRDRITSKCRWDITCKPLTAQEAATILQLIKPEYITVTYTDPETNSTVTRQMYSNSIPAQYLMRKGNIEYWAGITFPVIER